MRSITSLIAALLCLACLCGAHARLPADSVLVDQRGSPFTLRGLHGAPVVVTFIATRCTDACPLATAVFRRLARERAGPQLLTVTLDPRYDTPFVMARYAQRLTARAPLWRVASGKPENVAAVLDAFGVERAPADAHSPDVQAPDMHSTFIYCLDGWGRLAKLVPLSTRSFADVRAWIASTRWRNGG